LRLRSSSFIAKSSSHQMTEASRPLTGRSTVGGTRLRPSSLVQLVHGHVESVVPVCRVDGKVTYIHRRLWPALVKLASRFQKEQLAKVWNEHTRTGTHRSRRMPFPDWVPSEVMAQAQRLSLAEAEQILSEWPVLDVRRAKGVR
jgi:hypothetical protein